MEQYEIGQRLGKGGMGTAYIVTRKGKTARLALKCVSCSDQRQGNDALNEAKILQSLQHAHIVKYHDVFLNNDKGMLQVCTVMEFCQAGDLATHLLQLQRSGSHLPEPTVCNWMVQLLEALSYVHRMRILHRDLKPPNIFLHPYSRSNYLLKLGDFGLSVTLEAGKRTSRVGTPCYLAPEILFSEPYAEPVDMWGIGCIGYEILTLDFLWQRKGMLGVVVQDQPIRPRDLPVQYSEGLRGQLCACLSFAAGARPAAADLVRNIRLLQDSKQLAPPPPPAEEPQPDGDWSQPVLGVWDSLSSSLATGLGGILTSIAAAGGGGGGGGYC